LEAVVARFLEEWEISCSVVPVVLQALQVLQTRPPAYGTWMSIWNTLSLQSSTNGTIENEQEDEREDQRKVATVWTWVEAASALVALLPVV